MTIFTATRIKQNRHKLNLPLTTEIGVEIFWGEKKRIQWLSSSQSFKPSESTLRPVRRRAELTVSARPGAGARGLSPRPENKRDSQPLSSAALSITSTSKAVACAVISTAGNVTTRPTAQTTTSARAMVSGASGPRGGQRAARAPPSFLGHPFSLRSSRRARDPAQLHRCDLPASGSSHRGRPRPPRLQRGGGLRRGKPRPHLAPPESRKQAAKAWRDARESTIPEKPRAALLGSARSPRGPRAPPARRDLGRLRTRPAAARSPRTPGHVPQRRPPASARRLWPRHSPEVPRPPVPQHPSGESRAAPQEAKTAPRNPVKLKLGCEVGWVPALGSGRHRTRLALHCSSAPDEP
ncbi:basic salivary proline-rich protein 1-like [Heterocephalus glaber]|uniref:Basic salivary proline-rich protein 1-like n=1 Tax=Heterocephalus glaber TaxID=10181 RepID=A0AAX6RK85_HETGA|nr:basic salivary proline-rich protein 1-like [Heterocephalus glaber]